MDINRMKRHMAKIANTDQRCVVVMMQIPGREDHALVLPTDNLSPRYEQAVMTLLESNEGQSEEVFGNILSRRIMPDTGKAVLETLHNAQKLVAVPCANVIMMPLPNMPFPLVSLLAQMGKTMPVNNMTPPVSQPSYAETTKHNQMNANRAANASEQNAAVANNLLIEAQMLERDAARKREQAYTFNPSLRPPELQPATAATSQQADLYAIANSTLTEPLPKAKRAASVRGPSKKSKAEPVS